MDAEQFDTLARSLTEGRSRRGALAAVVGGVLGVAGLAEAGAKKKKPCPPCKKRKQGKCKKKLPDGTACPGGICQGGRCASPTCSDGAKNGSETDVDCGGDCPRCLNGRTCSSRDDCVGALCKDGTCQVCLGNPECGTDDNGACGCQQPATGGSRVCTGTAVPPTVMSCAACPPGGTICVAGTVPPGSFNCFKPCGVA